MVAQFACTTLLRVCAQSILQLLLLIAHSGNIVVLVAQYATQSYWADEHQALAFRPNHRVPIKFRPRSLFRYIRSREPETSIG